MSRLDHEPPDSLTALLAAPACAAIAPALREALREDQLEPYLQPIVRLDDGRVVGHEALLRWIHPRRGVLCPGDFLQVAEETGLIEAIDWRVFKRSMAHVATLDDDSYLTINVAPRHLRQEDFAPRLLQLVTYVVPARYFLVALRGIVLKGSAIETLWMPLAALAIYAVAMLSLASVRLAREHA